MLPRVLVHSAVSLDGRTVGFDVDMGQFYGAVRDWGADCMLTGADTIVRAPEYVPDDPEAPAAQVETAARQILAVVDSRGRVRNWRTLKSFGQFWRDPVALVSGATPAEYLEEVRRAGCDALVAGDERVDLRAALELLAGERGVTRVRVDSGGSLSGALLRTGLVHEVSLMVQPLVVGGDARAFDWGAGGARPNAFSLADLQRLDGGVVWLRYEVTATA